MAEPPLAPREPAPRPDAPRFLGWLTARSAARLPAAVAAGRARRARHRPGSLIDETRPRRRGHVVVRARRPRADPRRRQLTPAQAARVGRRGPPVLARRRVVAPAQGPAPAGRRSSRSGCSWRWCATATRSAAAADPALAARRSCASSPIYLGAVLIFGFVSLLFDRDHVSPGLTVGGMLQDDFAGLVGLDGPLRLHRQRSSPTSSRPPLLALGIAGLADRVPALPRVSPRVRGPSDDDRERAARLVRALRLGHARLLRPAHRQELLLLQRRRRDDRLHLRRPATRSSPPTRSARPARRSGSSTSSSPSAATARWHVAFLAVREADLPLYERARLQGRLPRRRGDHPLRHVQPRGRRDEGRPRRRSTRVAQRALTSGSSARPTPRRRCVAQLNEIRERWRGKAPERGLHDGARRARSTATSPTSCSRSPRRGRASGRLPAARARATATTPATRSTSCSATPTRPTASPSS